MPVDLTNKQIEYLMHIYEKRKDMTVSDLSRYFNCSKVNSKYIVDRMIKLGVFYKENNYIKLTKIGDKVADIYKDRKSDMQIVFEEAFGIEKDQAEEISEIFMDSTNTEFQNRMKEISSILNKLRKKSNRIIKSSEIENILNRGEYEFNLTIFKERDKFDSAIRLSMADRAFDSEGKLFIGDNSEAELYPSKIIRSLDGYINKGFLKEIIIAKNGQKVKIPSENKVIRIPINLIDSWYYHGAGIMQSVVDMEIVANINFSREHKNRARFVFTLNLMKI